MKTEAEFSNAVADVFVRNEECLRIAIPVEREALLLAEPEELATTVAESVSEVAFDAVIKRCAQVRS